MPYQRRNTATILVDIIVTNNNQLRALRPVYDSKNPMSYTEPEKSDWLKTHVNTDRLQKRILGNIGGSSLHKVKRFVNYTTATATIDNNNNTITKELGSLYIFEDDFVRLI
jgi:hypothetical protein